MKQYYKNGVCYPDDGFTVIPKDAVLIPADHWFLSLMSLPRDKVVVTGGDGFPVLVDIPPESVDDRCQKACDLIDNTAGEARKRLASPGWGIETEYRHSYTVAVAYLEEDSEDEIPLPVQIHARNNGLSYKEAAQDIVKRYKKADNVLEIIYGIRMDGKASVKKAANETPDIDLMSTAQPFIDQLNAVGV